MKRNVRVPCQREHTAKRRHDLQTGFNIGARKLYGLKRADQNTNQHTVKENGRKNTCLRPELQRIHMRKKSVT